MIQVWCGLLLLFFIANGVFIYLALTSNPGLVVDNYYDRGQDYENTMMTRMAADANWDMHIELIDKPVQNQSGELRFFLTDNTGELQVPDLVTLFVYRTSNAKDDFDVPMKELNTGVYSAEVAFPLPGTWDLLAVVLKDGAEFSEALRINVVKAQQ
ncbi:MAG: FixH family protein [Motiliproteus sp.]